MKPLVFLTVRILINGIKRAVTSPRRLIGLAVLLVYWFRFFAPTFSDNAPASWSALGGRTATLPPNNVIEACVFGLFGSLSLMMMLSALTPRGGFRPADIDVLFATPINPKAVLIFRMVRDTLVSLLIPLLFAVFARPVALPISAFFTNFPAQGQLLGKTATIAWLLIAVCWTMIGHAISLFIGRSDERSDRNKKVIDWGASFLLVGVMTFIGLRLRADFSLQTAYELAHHPLLRSIFFSGTLATMAVMAIFTGAPVNAALALLGLVLVAIGGYAVALTQVQYMYDQAAARGFDSTQMKDLQRSGDTYAIVAAQARRGKVHRGRFARWIASLRFRGASALLWKELLLQARGSMWQYAIFGPMVITLVILPVWGGSKGLNVQSERYLLLMFTGISVMMMAFQSATSGFIELLRRVDFQKPLPFTSTTTVFWEVVAKAIPTTLICGLACLGVLIVDIRIWDTAIGCMFIAPSLCLTLVAVVLLVTVLFPDIDDATQRSFRGLMMLLGSVISAMPMMLLVGLLTFLNVNGLLIAVPAVAINIGVAIGLSALAGSLYSGFNPSE